MLTLDDFVAKYDAYSDDELNNIYENAENYSEEAGEALQFVVKKRGGREALIKRLEENLIIENEKIRIANESAVFGLEGVDESFVKATTTSAILSQKEVNEIIEDSVAKAAAIAEDKKVNADTVAKSMLGGALASIAGGAFASLQLLYFGATSVLMVIGTALICYGIVKLVTKKSYNNTAVLLAAFAAFILAHLIAMAAFSIFGYVG